jgi:hypothetical protein
MAKRRAPWERLYDEIRVIRSPNSVCVPPARDAELDGVESELGSRLPHSYREFMKRFGPGELQGWLRLYAITPGRKRDPWTVAGRTKQIQQIWPKYADFSPNHEWLSSLVYFASNGGGDEYAWDSAAKSRSRTHECRFYFLPRLNEDHPVAAGDSFWEFIEWVDADIRSWRDPEWIEEHGPGMYFSPAYLRAKKRPLKRDVQMWLKWNNGTVRQLARSIREEGRVEAFPVLADALEDAGCTNADLLNSCRSGTPDIDGAWALRVLLGEADAKPRS